MTAAGTRTERSIERSDTIQLAACGLRHTTSEHQAQPPRLLTPCPLHERGNRPLLIVRVRPSTRHWSKCLRTLSISCSRSPPPSSHPTTAMTPSKPSRRPSRQKAPSPRSRSQSSRSVRWMRWSSKRRNSAKSSRCVGLLWGRSATHSRAF